MRFKSRRRPRSSSVLLLAAGALAGLAVGALLADRVGGVDALMSKSKRKAKVPSRTRPEELHEGLDAPDDNEQSDEAELVHAMSPDEATLEARVLEAFHNDPVLRERAIDIGAIGTGVIELTGWVQTRAEIGHAITLARGVPDVSTVVDRLAVREVVQRREARNSVDVPLADVTNSMQPPRAD